MCIRDRWTRTIDIPATMRGKRIFLHIRGARLRAEVYLNQQLVGYSIMEELPFECDLTHAANPGGDNHLAIRITNPFGRFDWVDGSNAKWGHLALYRSHGFGGLDRGMTISAHDGVRIKDMWVLSTPRKNISTAYLTLENRDSKPIPNATVHFEVIDPKTKKVIGKTISMQGITDGGSITSVKQEAGSEDAVQWDIDDSNLYWLRATLDSSEGTDTRTIAFGFRWFAPEGLGANALFRLNGRRIRIYTAISWGYWGLNGLFPVPELAEKEVTAAKALGLNCLNFHRNLAKEDVLRKHDELGLLRYMAVSYTHLPLQPAEFIVIQIQQLAGQSAS